MDSHIRLVTTCLIEYGEDWSTGRCYIKLEIIQLTRVKNRPLEIKGLAG